MYSSDQPGKGKQKALDLVLILLALLVLIFWLIFTPPGLDGKIHAAGYSVCHQLETHSLQVDGKTLPLCARCTGTFLGLLVSTAYLSRGGKRGAFPPRWKSAILVLFFLAFAFDGVNSTLSLLPGFSLPYVPDNRVRLATGLLFGIALTNLLLPLWHQTLWDDYLDSSLLHTWRQLFSLVLLIVFTWVLILADVPFLYYPIAILSTLSIFLVLSMVYALLWCIILKKENSLHHLRDGKRIFIAGLITAIAQVGLMDWIRFLLTGTWESFI
jgi:uncharacterized membrane protein